MMDETIGESRPEADESPDWEHFFNQDETEDEEEEAEDDED